ncbi:hypothetical protein [Sagittula sp. MA-2]|jgi:hypothetical protein|uniref:hypothetical protein n=1 Tax=Sagittula sp. MA-2 TaxID=3048007 RepID=UPI0024C3E69C|nr:hypothetical protein [Sagittula sp. MA-2]WHZ35756.1 hypothetical protein QNI11_01835 [Sagittula sp. MA-2]
MVETAKFRKKMAAMRTEVHEALVRSVEANAEKVCAEMRAMLAIQRPAVAAQVDIDWTWGDAPKGSFTIGKASFNGAETTALTVTIYARAKSGSGISAGWFEFGTAPRFHESGKATGRITATPFFFPVYRSNRQRVQSSLRAALRRAVKKINAS